MRQHPREVRRLCYLAVARVPGERAHSIQIAKTCEALARRLDELELVVPRLGPPGGDPPQGIRLVRVPGPNFLPLGRWAPAWLMRILFDVQSAAFALAALSRALLRHRFDVYYTRSPFVALAFALAFGRRAVLELHLPVRSPTRRGLLRLCRAFGCRFAAISDALRQRTAELLHARPDEIGVAHDGFDPSHFQQRTDPVDTRHALGVADDAFVLCYVGTATTLGTAKGIPLIIEAFRQAALPGATLLLAGVEPSKAIPQAEGVRFLGWVAHERVGPLLAASDGAVMLFLDDPAHARAMSPLKLFEYMAAGLPIITPDLPNLREVLDESCALFVPTGTVAALADGMRRLWSDPALRARLGAAAAERAAGYTWDARAARLLRFLESRPT